MKTGVDTSSRNSREYRCRRDGRLCLPQSEGNPCRVAALDNSSGGVNREWKGERQLRPPEEIAPPYPNS